MPTRFLAGQLDAPGADRPRDWAACLNRAGVAAYRTRHAGG